MKLILILLVITVLVSQIYCSEHPVQESSRERRKAHASQDNNEPQNEQVRERKRKDEEPRIFAQHNYGNPEEIGMNSTQHNYGVMFQTNYLPSNKTQNGSQLNQGVLFQDNIELKNRTRTHKKKSNNKDKKRQSNRKNHRNNNKKSRHNKKRPEGQNKTSELSAAPAQNKRAKTHQRNAGAAFRNNYRKIRKETDTS